MRFGHIPQAGFILGGGARLRQAGSDARDFPGQRLEVALIRHVRRLRHGSHAQFLKPIGHAAKRTP